MPPEVCSLIVLLVHVYGPRAFSFSFVYTILNCHLLPLPHPLLSPPFPPTPQLWATTL